MCSSVTDLSRSGSGAFSAEIELHISPIGLADYAAFLLRCRLCATSLGIQGPRWCVGLRSSSTQHIVPSQCLPSLYSTKI
jgi:hypothetical protein